MKCGLVGRIEAAFGWRGFPHALFYKAEYALRFELAGDAKSAPLRLVRAMDRARIIADVAFAGSEILTAVACHYGVEKSGRRVSASLRRLAEIGFDVPLTGPDRVTKHEEEHIRAIGEDQCRHWYAADFHKSDALVTALLWAALVQELGISPAARWLPSIYIVDFTRRIAVHAYDDRGMDVIGPDRETLLPLYERLNMWLLNYDRDAMVAKFR